MEFFQNKRVENRTPEKSRTKGLEIISLFAVISYDFETSYEEPVLISLFYADNAEVFVYTEKPRVHIP